MTPEDAARSMGRAFRRGMVDVAVKVADDFEMVGEKRKEFIRRATSARVCINGRWYQSGPTDEELRR